MALRFSTVNSKIISKVFQNLNWIHLSNKPKVLSVVLVTVTRLTCYGQLAAVFTVEFYSSCFSDSVSVVLCQCGIDTSEHTPVKVGPLLWSHNALLSQFLANFVYSSHAIAVFLMHILSIDSMLRCTFVHVNQCSLEECSLLSGFTGSWSTTKNTNPFSELHSLSPSLRFLPLLKPPVPLGAANVSDIDPSSGSRLLLAPALHQNLRRCSSGPLSKVTCPTAGAHSSRWNCIHCKFFQL